MKSDVSRIEQCLMLLCVVCGLAGFFNTSASKTFHRMNGVFSLVLFALDASCVCLLYVLLFFACLNIHEYLNLIHENVTSQRCVVFSIGAIR